VSDGSGVSRGDRNRNARLARLREAVPLSNAIVGIDLADATQMVVVTDHEPRVLARRMFRRRAWQLGTALDWAATRAAAAGFAGVPVAVGPAGHRWRVAGQLAAGRGMVFVCVQPLMSAWARRAGDLTFGKTDGKDAVLIARLAAQLRCYLPEPVDAAWGRRRHLGVRRARLVTEQVAQVQQMRDLLECVWPAALDAARQPFKSMTWRAALAVALDRAGGDLSRVTRLGRRRFGAAVRRQVARQGAVHPWQKIIDAVFAACADLTGGTGLRPGALERVALLLDDWRATQIRLAGTEQRLVTVLDELGLTELVTSLTGLSAAGAASILAETGDPARFTPARALVKHAGLAPRQKSSGSCTGQTRTTGQGRPALRLAAWRAVWGALKSNPVYAARFAHLTSREHNKLSTGQAHAALAAASLRHLHAVITTGQRWDPAIATGGSPAQDLTAA
jgi:transposase